MLGITAPDVHIAYIIFVPTTATFPMCQIKRTMAVFLNLRQSETNNLEVSPGANLDAISSELAAK